MSKSTEKKAWFAPKRYGYGAGLPISWEGWALTIVMVILTIFFATKYRELNASLGTMTYWVLLIALFLGYGALAKSRTRGGWRLRKGEE